MPLPQVPVTETPNPNPIEALPAPASEGFVSGMYSGLEKSLGISLETQAIGKMAGGTFVPYADAKAQMEAQGYDASVLPSTGLNSGELQAIMNQQSAIKRNEAIVQQSDLGPTGRMVSHFIGGAGDPLFLAAGPVLGRLGLTVRGMGLGGRIAAGATEGGATMAGYDIATRQFGTAPGDHDIGTQQIVQDSLLGGLVGGVLHGTFGQRAAPKPNIDSYLNMIQIGENTAGASKQMGVPENAVTSSKGAVGRYQVTPGTAKQYGFNPDMLKDPAYNKEVATAILTDLQKKFGDDPDAIAIGYNAGPGVAKKFLASGRDRSVLPKETRDYLNRIAANGGRPEFGLRTEVPPAVDVAVKDAAETSLMAAESDARPHIGFGVNDLHGQHQDWIDSITTDATRDFEETSKPEYQKAAAPEALDFMTQLSAIEKLEKGGHVGTEFRGYATAADQYVDGYLSGKWRGTAQEDVRVQQYAANHTDDIEAAFQRRQSNGFRQKIIPSHPASSVEPGSRFTKEPAAQPITDRIASGATVNDTTELQASADAAVKEAQAHSPEGEEFAAHMEDVEDHLHKEGYSDEMVKAVHAAIRCGLSRGFD